MQERAQSRIQLLTIFLVAFVACAAITGASLAVIYHLKEHFHLDAAAIGLLSQTSTLSYLIGCLALAPLTERLKPYQAVSCSLFGQGLALLVFLTVPNLAMACASLAVYGLCQSMLWPANEGWLTRGRDAKDLANLTTAYNFTWSFGLGLATLFSGMLAERSAALSITVSAMAMTAIGFWTLFSSLLTPLMRQTPSEHVASKTLTDHSTPLRYNCWLGIILAYLGCNMFLTIFPIYAEDRLGISRGTTGALLLARGFTSCLTFLLLARHTGWRLNKRFVALTQIGLFALFLIGTPLRSLWQYALYFVAYGIFFAFAYQLSIFHSAYGATRPSRRMAIHETVLTAGQVVGAALGGWIYEKTGFPTVLFCFAGISAVVIVSECLFRRPGSPSERGTETDRPL